MFTIDLLKGTGIPLQSSPGRTVLRAVPFLVPALLVLGLLGHYAYNQTLLGTKQENLERMQARITKVLVICPTSLKAQWRSEIHRFSERDCRIVLGTA